MIKKLYLILILCLFVFSCGSNEESINISEEIPTSLIKSPEKNTMSKILFLLDGKK